MNTICKYCNKEFIQNRKDKKYCSDNCRKNYNRKHKNDPDLSGNRDEADMIPVSPENVSEAPLNANSEVLEAECQKKKTNGSV